MGEKMTEQERLKRLDKRIEKLEKKVKDFIEYWKKKSNE